MFQTFLPCVYICKPTVSCNTTMHAPQKLTVHTILYKTAMMMKLETIFMLAGLMSLDIWVSLLTAAI